MSSAGSNANAQVHHASRMPSAIVARLAIMSPTVAQALPACALLTVLSGAHTQESLRYLSCREQEFEKSLPGKNGARSYTTSRGNSHAQPTSMGCEFLGAGRVAGKSDWSISFSRDLRTDSS